MKLFKETLKTLESSKEFKDWRKKNPTAYLSYGFFAIEEVDTAWKIGYYHKNNNKITSFTVGKKIKLESDEEPFKKEKSKVEKIDLKKLKFDLAEALVIANELQKEEFATENPRKVIAILQTLDVGQVWNITFLTQSFNTLNFKIKSENGRVMEKKLAPLFGFDK